MKPSALLLPTLLLPVTALSAVTAPYSENFNGLGASDVPPNFTEGGTTSLLSIVNEGSGDDGYRFSIGSSQNALSRVEVTNVVGVGFSMSANFTINSFNSTGTANIGFVVLGSTTFGSGYRFTYNVGDASTPGVMNMSELGSPEGESATNASTGPGLLSPLTDTLYTFTVNGTYNELGHLTIEAIIRRDGESRSLTATDTTPRTGQSFGFRSATSGTGTGVTVTYDDFSIAAIPEPGSSAFILFGVALLAGRRSRR